VTPTIQDPVKSAVQVSVQPEFPLYALPRLWQWAEDSRHQVADQFSPKTLDEFVNSWERQAVAGQRSWCVWVNGELGGAVWSTRLSPVLADSHCIFKRSFWGQGITREALRLVYAEIFAGGIEKIAIVCFVDSHALLGLVRKLGFEREGTLKKSTLRDGQLVDQAVIGLTKEAFEELFGEKRTEEPAEVAENVLSTAQTLPTAAPVKEDRAVIVHR